MAYSITDWVDGVTPVNANNLDKMEAGIAGADTVAAAAQPKSEKAQPNGYPSLDANGKIPVAQIGGGGVDYIGPWGGATTYKQGDVVRYGPVDYLAVNPSTGQTPPVFAPASAQYLPVPLVTTLPASPFDGQEAILTDSLTAPTYTWRFRYNAGSASAYKWEFVGGPELQAGPTAGGTTNSAAVTPVPSGPTLVVPRSGDYSVGYSLGVQLSGTTGLETLTNVVGTTTPKGTDFSGATLLAQYWGCTVSFIERRTLVAGETINITTLTRSGGSPFAAAILLLQPSLRITPRRVS